MGNGLWRLETVESDERREEAEKNVEIHNKNFFLEKYSVDINDIEIILEYLLEIYPESMISDMLGTGWKKEDEDNIKRDIEDAVRWVRNGHKIDEWIKLHKSLHNRSMGKEATSERLSSTSTILEYVVEFVDNGGSVLFTLDDVQSVDIQNNTVILNCNNKGRDDK